MEALNRSHVYVKDKHTHVDMRMRTNLYPNMHPYMYTVIWKDVRR